MQIANHASKILRGKNLAGDEYAAGSLLEASGPAIGRVGRVRGWVERSNFQSLDRVIQKKVISAMEKGVVPPTGSQGIIKLTAAEAAATGYTHKIKILEKGGDIRIYGTRGANSHIFFDQIMRH